MASHACLYGGPRGIKEENCVHCLKAKVKAFKEDELSWVKSFETCDPPILHGETLGCYANRLLNRIEELMEKANAPRCFTDIPVAEKPLLPHLESIPDKGTPYPDGISEEDFNDDEDDDVGIEEDEDLDP